MIYFIEGIKQDDSQVEDVDIIVDDSSPDIIDVDTKSDTVDDDQLCFGTASLDPFHYNMCKNTYGQDGNEMIDIIILGENIWITSLMKTTIFQLRSLKHSLYY